MEKELLEDYRFGRQQLIEIWGHACAVAVTKASSSPQDGHRPHPTAGIIFIPPLASSSFHHGHHPHPSPAPAPSHSECCPGSAADAVDPVPCRAMDPTPCHDPIPVPLHVPPPSHPGCPFPLLPLPRPCVPPGPAATPRSPPGDGPPAVPAGVPVAVAATPPAHAARGVRAGTERGHRAGVRPPPPQLCGYLRSPHPPPPPPPPGLPPGPSAAVFPQDYEPTIFYPKRSPDPLHRDFTTQCEKMDIPFLSYLPTEVQLINDAYNAVVDAVLGAEGTEGTEPCAATLATLRHVRIPIVSLDVPSGAAVSPQVSPCPLRCPRVPSGTPVSPQVFPCPQLSPGVP
ncbi:hypothetical protein DV515_00016595 [Chloebia gouldiae]|uniref:Uncharacterized protein n=1 Tax=Chloebia gouldiae TaxID=44316 RepID=A0A3L8RS30_CHLGU|nr:hypothetical protein DV515_00016595 [Chloebia gouldiae]